MQLFAALPLDLSGLTNVLLLATRLGGLLLMTPPLGGAAIPPTVRVAFVFALAAMLAPLAPPLPAPLELGSLLAAAIGEFALGATMALGVSLAFAMFSVAGRLLDVQIGFGIGQVLDPLTRQQLPVLSGAFNQLALVAFFVADAHHGLLRGLVLGIERFPPGTGWPLGQAIAPLMQQVSAMFSLGFAMVAPVVFCLVLVELGLGVVSRNLPQMNMFALGIPVKVVVGLAGLALWIGGSASVIARSHASIFKGWEALFR